MKPAHDFSPIPFTDNRPEEPPQEENPDANKKFYVVENKFLVYATDPLHAQILVARGEVEIPFASSAEQLNLEGGITEQS